MVPWQRPSDVPSHRLRAIILAALVSLSLSGCTSPMALLPEQLQGNRAGDLTRALLLDDPYPNLVVEIDTTNGYTPCPETLDALRENLDTYTLKQFIRILSPARTPAEDGEYSNHELIDIHRALADEGPVRTHGKGQTAHLHVIFLNGQPEGADGHGLGRTSQSWGVIFLFPDAYENAYSIQGGKRVDMRCALERTIMLHELGHAYGLVDDGVPALTERETSPGSGHSLHPDSVMTERIRMGTNGLLLAPLPQDFDAHDRDDLFAYVRNNN